MISNNDIMKSLPLLASVLGDRYGVKVEVGGSDAYTDGRTIHLPSLPTDADDKLMDLTRGFLDHEAAHVRFTDFNALNAAGLDRVTKWAWNVLEDYRVEHRLADHYAGCASNFRKVIRHLFLKPSPSRSSAELPLTWLLRTVRSWDVAPDLDASCKRLSNKLDASFPGLRQQLEFVLQAFKADCPDTSTALGYAGAIADLLRNYSPPSPADEPNTASRSRSEKQGDLESEPEVSDYDRDDERSDAAQADEPGNPSDDGKDSLDGLFSDPSVSLPPTTGESMAKILGKNADSRSGVTIAVPEQGGSIERLEPELLAKTRLVTAALKSKLQGLLQARTLGRSALGRHGRLSARHLHKLAVADPRVFLTQSQIKTEDTAVMLLLDASYSMEMSKTMPQACAACSSIAEALQMPGVSVAVTSFPGRYDKDTVRPILSFGEHPPRGGLSVEACGCTPTGPAMYYAALELTKRREPRKVILVITDGEPDNSSAVLSAMKFANGIRVEVYGIGLNAPFLSYLIPESLNINNIEELPAAMFRMLNKAMICGC